MFSGGGGECYDLSDKKNKVHFRCGWSPLLLTCTDLVWNIPAILTHNDA